MKNRITEFDYLRSVCIILMVMFHLAWFADKHPLLKQFVYTFHMPVFLLVSGYLTNTDKATKSYLRSLLWLFVPYAIMETGYTIMAHLLPIREHIDTLNATVLLDRLFLHPLGPYWFVHTLIILQAILLAASRVSKANIPTFVVILITLAALLSRQPAALISFDNAIYFILGAVAGRTKTNILSLFPVNNLLPLILLVLLSLDTANCQRGTLSGFIIVWAVISTLLYIYRRISAPHIIIYLGRNTLPILLFSPIFTLAAKSLIPLLSFDPTAVIFMLLSTPMVIVGSLLIAKILDTTRLSLVFAGKKLLN